MKSWDARCGVGLGLGLLLLAGCQVPPAGPSACGSSSLPRPVLLTRQVVADTAVVAAAHPGRGAYVLATEPGAYLHAWAAGLAEKRVALKFLGPSSPVLPDWPTLDPDELETEALRASGEPPSAADLRLYVDGGAALTAVERIIDEAACQLDVLMYLWGNDDVGWRLARRLAARASPALPVRVLVDGGGNLAQGEPRAARAAEVNRAVCWLARQPHVRLLRTRNPAFRFDHRKLVVADGRVAWSGGRNFLQTSFERDHDLSYTVGGPLAGQMAGVFEEFWQNQGGAPGLAAPAPAAPESPNALARVVRTRPVEHALAGVLYRAVERARHHVYAENPYFSDNHLIYLLAKARQRGADVRAVLTLNSDSPVYDRANRVTANRLLRAGVRVYLYPGMTHVKALAVDGVWAYAGTGNFDNLSLRHNRELGLAVSGGPAVQEIEDRLFLPDLNPAWELTGPLPLSPLDYLFEIVAGLAA